jgi:hypothetical protein
MGCSHSTPKADEFKPIQVHDASRESLWNDRRFPPLQRLSDAPMRLLFHTLQPTSHPQPYPHHGGGINPSGPGSNISNPGPFNATNQGLWQGPQPLQPPTDILTYPQPPQPHPQQPVTSWPLPTNPIGGGPSEPLLDTANDDLANTIAVGKQGRSEAQQQQEHIAQFLGCTVP